MSLLANYPFFFDGSEYVALSRLPILESLRLAHPIAHPISMMLWRLAYLGLGSSITGLSLVSVIFWIMGMVLVARCVEKDRRVWVYVVCLFLPLPWLLMTNVLVDAVSTALFIGGVALLWRRRDWIRIMGATTLFGISILNYLGMAVWIAIPLAIIGFDRDLTGKKKMAMMGVVLSSLGIGLEGLRMMGLLTTKVGVGLSSIPVAMYHAGVAFVTNYTWVSAFLVVGFGISWLRKREWKKLLIMVGIGFIYTISLLPWHSGPYGRLGIFVVYPLAYLYSRLPKWIIVFVIVLVLPSWFKVVRAYKETPLPILQQELVDTSKCSDKQLVFSEIQRPQLSPIYPSAWYAGPANWKEVVVKIRESENICISQQAMDYPYRQYEGQLPYPLSGREGSKGFISTALQDEQVEVVGVDDKHPELTIYRLSR